MACRNRELLFTFLSERKNKVTFQERRDANRFHFDETESKIDLENISFYFN